MLSSSQIRSSAKVIYFNFRRMWLCCNPVDGGSLTILNFHKVDDIPDAYYGSVDCDVFEAFVLWAKRHFEIVALSGAVRAANDKPLLVLSFDDGFLGFQDHVMPILQKHGVPVNLNIITGVIADGQSLWNIDIYDFLRERGIDAFLRAMPEFNDLKNSAPRPASFALQVSSRLKGLHPDERSARLRPFYRSFDLAADQRTQFIDRSGLANLDRDLVEIGLHSHTHNSMGSLSDAEFQKDTLRGIAAFESLLGARPKIYAFPNGSHRPDQVAWLAGQGVDNVLLVEEKRSRPEARVHPRVTAYGDSLDELIVRTTVAR